MTHIRASVPVRCILISIGSYAFNSSIVGFVSTSSSSSSFFVVLDTARDTPVPERSLCVESSGPLGIRAFLVGLNFSFAVGIVGVDSRDVIVGCIAWRAA